MMQEEYQKMKYQEFFYYEINKFIENENQLISVENNDENNDEKNREDFIKFKEKRKKGENDHYLCSIIQEDQIEEFIIYVNKECISLNSLIKESIFETNNFLLKTNETTLIEYAAFYGSIQIFKYLYLNDAEITDNICQYAIHGYDEEIIHILEEKNECLLNFKSKKCYIESIKCHHIDLTKYIEENLYENAPKYFNYLEYCLKYYSFIRIDEKIWFNNFFQIFKNACKYDYFKIVKNFLSEKNIDCYIDNIFIFLLL